jgi:hypothetical protein
MHTMLTGWSLVDHKNGNGLDNTRTNMREATNQENARNQHKRAGTSSQYKGVCFIPVGGRWMASICLSGRSVHLGYHATEELAALAYDTAAREHFGEFARPNFPDPTTNEIRA